MTTDITELAQSLKAAAEKATPGEWVYFPKNTSIEYDVGSDESQGSILYVDSGDFTQVQTDRNGEFIALANPANILALVGALEKAKGMEAYWKTQCRGITDHCEELQQRITELESHKAALLKFIRDSCYVFDGADEDISDAYVDAITSVLMPKLESVAACNPPLFWVRVKSDGGYEGPIHDSKLEEVRKKSGKWLPLTLAGGIPELESRTVTVKQGEVLVTVAGFTGCGKSAIAGEIEIAMKAIGLPVTWANGDSEKRMTGADWLTAIEMYKPTVRIVEVNIPRAAGIKVEAE
ncbi:ead/Ea22-like family protein [Klebsiella variicola]|uniref:ead/Ea22-like family protein n=1 Tax=Klebsiella variicola TaxID=244366 RepID=UPI00388F05A7